MAIEKVLIVDDEILMRNFLVETLRRKNMDITTAENGRQAIALLKDHSYDLVITDMKMPESTGIEVLQKVKELSPGTLVVVITAFGSIENAVEAMRLGAFNYLLKPFSPDSIEALIEKAAEYLSLVEENQYLRLQQNGTVPGQSIQLICESPAMKKIYADILQIAKSNASVFISGESGTGKEVIAHAIHYNSLRAQKPFIKVNCAAIPNTLIESEFFGHEKGAFTGANSCRKGRFELANTGTLLLDEVSEIPIEIQAKFLRATQEMEFERIGGTKQIKVDVRLISTTNRNIKEMIEQKILREDLYYRLNVVPLVVPPLRERKEDILPLSLYFLEKMCQENHKEKKTLSKEAQQKLLDYSWPGNVRELSNLLERAVVMCPGKVIQPENLYLEQEAIPTNALPNSPILQPPTGEKGIEQGMKTLRELEKKLILDTLNVHQADQEKAAEALGMTLRKLRSKIKEYQIS